MRWDEYFRKRSPNGCLGSVFGFEAVQFADDGVAGNAFDQGQ